MSCECSGSSGLRAALGGCQLPGPSGCQCCRQRGLEPGGGPPAKTQVHTCWEEAGCVSMVVKEAERYGQTWARLHQHFSNCHVCGCHLGILWDVDSGSGVLGWGLRCCLLNTLTGVCGLHGHTFPVTDSPSGSDAGSWGSPRTGWL